MSNQAALGRLVESCWGSGRSSLGRVAARAARASAIPRRPISLVRSDRCQERRVVMRVSWRAMSPSSSGGPTSTWSSFRFTNTNRTGVRFIRPSSIITTRRDRPMFPGPGFSTSSSRADVAEVPARHRRPVLVLAARARLSRGVFAAAGPRPGPSGSGAGVQIRYSAVPDPFSPSSHGQGIRHRPPPQRPRIDGPRPIGRIPRYVPRRRLGSEAGTDALVRCRTARRRVVRRAGR